MGWCDKNDVVLVKASCGMRMEEGRRRADRRATRGEKGLLASLEGIFRIRLILAGKEARCYTTGLSTSYTVFVPERLFAIRVS